MAIDVMLTTSAEEDLEALTRHRWEISPIDPYDTPLGERKAIAPPPSQNTVSWWMSEPCLVDGVSLWRDGQWFKNKYLYAPVSFQRGDTLTAHYNLSVC